MINKLTFILILLLFTDPEAYCAPEIVPNALPEIDNAVTPQLKDKSIANDAQAGKNNPLEPIAFKYTVLKMSTLLIECHPHPLDPLSAAEITLTSRIISKSPSLPISSFVFNIITLKEPKKSDLLPFFLSNSLPPPKSIPRKSFSIIVERGSGKGFEVITNLDTEEVESFTPIPHGLRPPINPEDMIYAEEVLRRDPEVQRRCAEAGYPNISLVNADPWSPGYIVDRLDNPAFQSKRLIQLYLYGKNHEDDNFYGNSFVIY